MPLSISKNKSKIKEKFLNKSVNNLNKKMSKVILKNIQISKSINNFQIRKFYKNLKNTKIAMKSNNQSKDLKKMIQAHQRKIFPKR